MKRAEGTGGVRILQFISIFVAFLSPLPAVSITPAGRTAVRSYQLLYGRQDTSLITNVRSYQLLYGRVYQDTSLITNILGKPAPTKIYPTPDSPVRAGLERRFPVEAVNLFAKPAPTTPDSRCFTQDIKTLTDQLLRDLPGYANRTSQRARKLNRSTDLYTYVLVAGQPEFEPLTTDPGVYQPKSPQADGEDVQQIFFTTLERQYLKDRAVELQGFHWAFFAKTEDGWRLASMFTRIGDRASKRPPTPPEETSDGIIAQAIETWLRDCRARSRARDAKE
ncbi:hypothetical protein H6G17_15455 [Chroococcidiopsis sp. FACHB-1243]|nr:hypothetical protein [Chroococcidiopsis sp. [FACHB-1243]]